MGALSRLAAGIANAACLLAVAACAAPGDELPAQLRRITPTASASASFTPLRPPTGFRTIAGEFYRLSIPTAWTDRVDTSSDAETKPVLSVMPGRTGKEIVWIGVTVDHPARSDVIEQSMVLETGKKATGATNVTRVSLAWPGAERAVLVGWEQAPGGSGGGLVRYEQFMAQLSAGTIVNVVARAPAKEYSAMGLQRIMRTLVLIT